MKRFYSFVFLALTVLSCNRTKESEGGLPRSDYFIDQYVSVNKIVTQGPLILKEGFASGDIYIGLDLSGDGIYGDKKKEIQNRLGDVSKIRLGSSFRPRTASVNPFIKLTVVSDSDFNDIPAGSPLDAVIRVLGATAYPVFKDLHGQSDFYNQELDGSLKGCDKLTGVYYATGLKEEMFPYFEKSYYWYEKYVSELQPDDLFLLDPCLWFIITEFPALKTHKLTITMEEEGGTTYSCDIDVEFPA